MSFLKPYVLKREGKNFIVFNFTISLFLNLAHCHKPVMFFTDRRLLYYDYVFSAHLLAVSLQEHFATSKGVIKLKKRSMVKFGQNNVCPGSNLIMGWLILILLGTNIDLDENECHAQIWLWCLERWVQIQRSKVKFA